MAVLFANDTIGPSKTVTDDYKEQLRKEHSGSKWGNTGARYSGRGVAELLNERPYIQSVLDFGAGKGSLGNALGKGLEWTNYDPGMPDYDQLPTKGKTFDLVVSTDVLEHVEAPLLEEAIVLMGQYAGKVLYLDIACYPTGKLFGEGPYKGQDMHLVIEDPRWWKDRTRELLPHLQPHVYEWKEKRSKGKTKTRCVLVYERV